MYKPPENSNRVKSIKSKFENIQTASAASSTNIPTQKNGIRHNLTNNNNNNKKKTDLLTNDRSKLFITRQLSDPVKRNIKRTPAFRLDRSNCEKVSFQRDAPHNRSYFENRVRQFNGALKPDCDNNNKISNKEVDKTKTEQANAKPALIKSKSSHDFAYIRSKFDNEKNSTDQRNCVKTSTNNTMPLPDLSLLYTEPIPKALRVSNDADTIHFTKTLKISDVPKIFPEDKVDGLTDTLKVALTRPLPPGPAPQKPPRTFEHTPTKDFVKNVSFLHLEKDDVKTKPFPAKRSPKKDPRYMLNKLETALRNNIIRKQNNVTSSKPDTTSGEDSDDSVLFRSKSKKRLPTHPNPLSNISSSFNCLNGFTQCASPYDKVDESSSSFFVSCHGDEEPVYAEPFNFCGKKKEISKNNRNSLYYMSTALLDNDGKNNFHAEGQSGIKEEQYLNSKEGKMTSLNQISAENSSLSSFTSDLDSPILTPQDENNSFESTVKIRNLISAFETNQIHTNCNEENNDRKNNQENFNTSSIDVLKMNLQKTLDNCFKSTSSENCKRVDQIVDKFQSYVRTMPKYAKPSLNKNDRLFDCCLIVRWDLKVPQITFKFPKNTITPNRIEDLCFPEAGSGPLDQTHNAQCYSLVITNDKGERTFGYCRRVIPEGSTHCIPIAYCILSKHRAPRFYKKILEELESRHGISNKLLEELISAFYNNKFPLPGQSVKINLSKMINELTEFQNKKKTDLNNDHVVQKSNAVGYGVVNNRINCELLDTLNGKTELTLTMHYDTRYEDGDLKPLHNLPVEVLLKIFASLLLERKVILISCMISNLSSCVDALQTILYPFSWPHTFIPILPQCLWDVVESPTPVICGILSVAVVNQHKIEDGIVVDLDVGNILSEEGDENSILSNSMKKTWLQGINFAKTLSCQEYVYSVYLSDAYMRVFILSLKHYRNHIHEGKFDKNSFIKNGKTKGIRRFLNWFTDTTLFTSFIDLVISNPDSFTLFDNRIELYGSDQTNEILTKLIDWKK